VVMSEKLTILLADDNADDALLLQCACSEAGLDYGLMVVQDGAEVIRYLQGEERYADRAAYPMPALLLLDLNLPRMDGMAVLRWVRQEPSFQRLPVIIVTGSLDERLADRAHALGANGLLVKPVAYHDLVEAIRQEGKHWAHEAELAGLPH